MPLAYAMNRRPVGNGSSLEFHTCIYAGWFAAVLCTADPRRHRVIGDAHCPQSCSGRNAQPDAGPVAAPPKDGRPFARKGKMRPLRGNKIDRGPLLEVVSDASYCAGFPPVLPRPEVDAFSAPGRRDRNETLRMAGKTPPARHDRIKVCRAWGAAASARLEATWPGLPARGTVDIGPDTAHQQWRSTRPGGGRRSPRSPASASRPRGSGSCPCRAE